MLAGIIGALCIGLPMFLFCTYQYGKSRQLENKLSLVEEEKSLQKQITLIAAKKPLDSGHVIEAGDLSTMVFTVEAGSEAVSDDAANYIGKRCRLSISKGSVLGDRKSVV